MRGCGFRSEAHNARVNLLEGVSMDDLTWLTEWYEQQCDGDWEHGYGVRIETLDNPGWSLRIDLSGTALEAVDFKEERVGLGKDAIENDDDWFGYRKDEKETEFQAVGGPKYLPAMVARFRRWATDSAEAD